MYYRNRNSNVFCLTFLPTYMIILNNFIIMDAPCLFYIFHKKGGLKTFYLNEFEQFNYGSEEK